MSDTQDQGKKRKRTGKEREERKRAAILAQQEAENKEDDTGNSDVKSPQAGEEVEETVPAEATTGNGRPSVDFEKAAKRIPQGLKSLHPVFKQAKSFETRRLIKKIKFLRTKDLSGELPDLEVQLKLVHDIQLHHLAQTHLLTRLRKHPQSKRTPLPESITSLLVVPASTSTAGGSSSAAPAQVQKAENRLCSAKIVAEKVKNVVSWVFGEEGAKLAVDKYSVAAPAAKAGKGVKPNVRIAEDSEEEESSDREEGPSRQIDDGSDVEDDGGDDAQAADAAGWESGSISGSDGGGGAFGYDSDAESDDSDAIPIPASKRCKPSPSSPPPKSKSAKQEKISKTSKPEKLSKDLSSSIFLPSLSVGFTRGDDGDSDPDLDDDPNGVAGKNIKERTNRRGQRARQAIWEKRYGKNAKHVVKAREVTQAEEQKAREKAAAKGRSRDSGWGARSGPGGGAGGWKQEQESAPSPAYTRAPAPASYTRAPAPTSTTSAAESKAALHPSWEAARLRKQKMEVAQTDVKAQKIVFD